MSTDPFYRSKEWLRFRTWFLSHHPLCAVPGCRTKPTHVDHVVSRRAGGADFDQSNCQNLCASHHNTKTAMRDKPFSKTNMGRLMVSGCDALGKPIDPEHPWNKPTGSIGGQFARKKE